MPVLLRAAVFATLSLVVAPFIARAQRVVVLPAPDFAAAAPAPPPASVSLVHLVSARRNRVSTPNDWLTRNGLALPLLDSAATAGPAPLPPTYGRLVLVRAIDAGDRILRIYGEDYASGALLVSTRTRDGAVEYVLDFASYQYAPQNIPAEREFTRQAVWWAWPVGETLYVTHGHLTYAKSSGGRNAYVTAIDTRAGRPLWHSPALVSNAQTFEVVGDYLITGYGFTAEPDFLYVLRRDTGRVVERVRVKSGPDVIVRRGDSLYVHTYDTDYVFEIVRR